MLIRRMTATFGRLREQTLELQDGLNILQAPNETGKSTWCAFLLAMLYIFTKKAGNHRDSIAQAEGFAQKDFKIDQRYDQISARSPAFYKKRKKFKKPLDKQGGAW